MSCARFSSQGFPLLSSWPLRFRTSRRSRADAPRRLCRQAFRIGTACKEEDGAIPATACSRPTSSACGAPPGPRTTAASIRNTCSGNRGEATGRLTDGFQSVADSPHERSDMRNRVVKSLANFFPDVASAFARRATADRSPIRATLQRRWPGVGMPARQFPIDKTPFVQPLMRAIFPGTLVDREFLPANGLACANPAGPNHVSAHDIETHGIKDFRVVRNFGHRIAPFSPRAQRLGRVRRRLIQLASNRATGSIRADHESRASSRPCAFAATMPQTLDAAHHADRREQGGRSPSTTCISARIKVSHHANDPVLRASIVG